MRLLKDSLITYATLVAQLLLSALATILITRSMGLAGKGEISLIVSVPGFLLLFGTFGTAHGAVYALGKNSFSPNQVIRATWVLTALESVLVCLVALPLWWMGQTTFLRGLDWRHLLFVVSLLPAEFLLNYGTYVLRGMGRPDLFNLYRLVRTMLYFLSLSALWLSRSLTIETALGVWALALVVSAVLVQARLWPLRRSVRETWVFPREPIAMLLRYGLQLYPTLILAFLGYRLDVFIINSILTKADVGAYTIAVSVAEIVWFIPNAVGIVLFPIIARMSAREANELTPLVLRQVMALTAAAVLGLFAIRRQLMIVVFGETAGLPAIPVLALLLPGVLAFSALKTVWQDLCGRGRPLLASLSMLVVVGLDVGLNCLLTPRLGVRGAAISASTAYFCGTLAALWWYRRYTRLSWSDLLMPTARDIELYRQVIARLWQALHLRPAPTGELSAKDIDAI